jgi:GTPase
MDFITTDIEQEKALLVGLINREQSPQKVDEYLDELAFLAETLGAETIARFTQRLDTPDVRSFVGKGKLEEIKEYLAASEADLVIFDDDLSPSQLRNLEKYLKCKIYDRSLLILDIFLKRAQTAQARTQVELARYQYLMPRLTRMWTHLERQRGGTGTRGGAGEKEIETDRRIIRNQISVLKKKLEKIEKQGRTQRKSRANIVKAALVGYTNVGKSTIMRLLTKSDVFAENKLFATVDTTVRKVVLDGIPFLLSDTVGFIRKLPHHLIESFKSTLDEVREADVLIHVVDVSHPSYEEQIAIVNDTLQELEAADKETILVFNKIDLLPKIMEENEIEEENTDDKTYNHLQALKQSFIGKGNVDAVFVSAGQKENIDELRNILLKKVAEKHFKIFPNYLNSNTYWQA